MSQHSKAMCYSVVYRNNDPTISVVYKLYFQCTLFSSHTFSDLYFWDKKKK